MLNVRRSALRVWEAVPSGVATWAFSDEAARTVGRCIRVPSGARVDPGHLPVILELMRTPGIRLFN